MNAMVWLLAAPFAAGLFGGFLVRGAYDELASYPDSDIEGARAAKRCGDRCRSENATHTVSLQACWSDLYHAKKHRDESEALRASNAEALLLCWDEILEQEQRASVGP